MAERAFSKKCGECRQRTMAIATIPYTIQIQHDGRTYDVTLPALTVPKCANCGAISIDHTAEEQIDAAFRHEAGLLSCEQIRRNREALGLTQKELANRLGIGEATLSRWETATQIQQRSMDRLLRLFFGLGDVRNALADDRQIAHLGSSVTTAAISAHENAGVTMH